ncbi:MAG: alpha/beta hydrolase [Reyranellaceae bacterium]
MPTSADAGPRPRAPAKPKQATRKPPAATLPRPAPSPLTPPSTALRDAKLQLIGFDSSAFPYNGVVPDTRKPFLDVRDGGRRGHTSLRGEVYWENPTYSDRRSLLYLPPGFDPQKPALIVLYLHGQGAMLERDVILRQGVPRQIAESGINAALVAPQLAVDAGDSSAGNFWKPGHFANYIDEAAERLMRLSGDRNAGAVFNRAAVIVVAYSGGYHPAAYALDRGGAGHRIRGVILMDALYGDEDKFAAWIAPRRRQVFLLSAYTESTKEENAILQGLLDRARVPYLRGLPSTLQPGVFAFAACGGLDLHGDFVTKAWRPDPLKHALALIPGYALRATQGA